MLANKEVAMNGERAGVRRRPTILAVASAGGHWVQLLRLRSAWEGCNVVYLTTDEKYRALIMKDAEERGEPQPRFFKVIAANRWQKLRLVYELLQIIRIVLRIRPDVVVSTGAAPGYFAIRVGKLLGAKTIWVDSIANANQLSLSGRMAGRHAGLWLTQWEHLEGSEDPEARLPRFRGATI